MPELINDKVECRALRLFKWYLAFLFILLFSNVLSYVRALGIWNHVHALIIFIRLFDFIFLLVSITVFFSVLRVKVSCLSYICWMAYPLCLGILYFNPVVTLLNDIVLYCMLLMKVWVFRLLFSYPAVINYFHEWIKCYLKYTIFMSVVMLLIAYSLLSMGYRFYFQAPVDVTYIMAIVSSYGQVGLMIFFLLYGLLCGKRMIFIGVLVIAMISIFQGGKRLFVLLFIASFLFFCGLFLHLYFDMDNVQGVGKFVSLFEKGLGEGDLSLMERFKEIDPARYLEVVSLWNSMSGIDFWVGKGFGYRYEYDLSILDYSLINYETHSNSHFTPLGIVSKFGFLGLFFWIIFFSYFIYKSFSQRKISHYHFANFLFLVSLIVQSFMAFSLFTNILLPIVLAYILSVKSK